MNDGYFKTIKEFRDTKPAYKLIGDAVKELLPTKGNRVGFIISFLIAMIFASIIGVSIKTVEILSNVVGVLLNVQLAMFGCVFTVYSILLAFLSDGYMKRLGKIETNNKTSVLKQSTTYYESILFLYFINIGITGVISLLTSCLSPDFRLTESICFDTILATGLLLIYFLFSFRLFYELKSTIYNTVVLFRASIAYRFIDYSVEENQENAENEKEEGGIH